MRVVSTIVLMLALTSSVAAEPGLKASEGWIREAPPTAPVRAGYAVLRNDDVVEQQVVAAHSPSFGSIEIHEMLASDDGTMRMRPVEKVTVPAGGIVRLEPGGLHLMLFRPAAAVVRGNRVELTLELADGSTIEAELEQR
jgi:copper(I)-binding protein